tara:strand:+ start:1213 stop:2892 length:1680 start_codon:yes stop_codon:yes gene_type:complete
MNNPILNTTKTIDKMYAKLTYFDQYSGSVIIFVVLLIVLGLVYAYTSVMRKASKIKENWINERCYPTVIPFAGFINKPYDKNAVEFTGENFQFCLNDILKNITGYATAPLEYLLSGLTDVFKTASVAIQYIRVLISNIRTSLSKIGAGVYQRLLNFIIPVQGLIVSIRDTLGKIHGTLVTSLYSSLSVYYILKSFLGSIAQLIVGFLGMLVTIIIAMWIFPWTWPAALTMTAVFISISIPLTIMLVFMQENFGILSSPIPGVPTRPPPVCFDAHTIFIMKNGNMKKIMDIQPGDIFDNNSVCTSLLKLYRGKNHVYNLDGTLVSGLHMVLYKDEWIYVEKHPFAVHVKSYQEPYLYCMNTNTKSIIHNGHVYCDWDEILNKQYSTELLNNLVNICRLRSPSRHITQDNLYEYLEGGFIGSTLLKMDDATITPIKNIRVGDILQNNIKVLGIVEIDGTKVKEQNEYQVDMLDNDGTFDNTCMSTKIECSPNVICYSPELKTCYSFLEINNNKKNNNNRFHYCSLNKKHDKLYHLITESQYFFIDNLCFQHYSSNIEYFFD